MNNSIHWIKDHEGSTGYGGPRTWRREQWGIPLTGVRLTAWVRCRTDRAIIMVKLAGETRWLRLSRRPLTKPLAS